MWEKYFKKYESLPLAIELSQIKHKALNSETCSKLITDNQMNEEVSEKLLVYVIGCWNGWRVIDKIEEWMARTIDKWIGTDEWVNGWMERRGGWIN